MIGRAPFAQYVLRVSVSRMPGRSSVVVKPWEEHMMTAPQTGSNRRWHTTRGAQKACVAELVHPSSGTHTLTRREWDGIRVD